MSKSDSEIRIENWLKLNDFYYKDEFSFKDCKYKNVLLFDYAIFNYNNELSCLIESQGKQHYEPIGYFGGINAFKEQQIKDKIKKEYCKKNNIQLLEISYWDFDYIECILEENILQQIS